MAKLGKPLLVSNKRIFAQRVGQAELIGCEEAIIAALCCELSENRCALRDAVVAL